MWFSSWLRNGKRSQSAQRRRAHGPVGQRAFFRPMLEALEDRWLPSQIGLTVTSLADSGDNNNPGVGTLRAAILTADAGNQSDQYTISFDPSLFTNGAQTINLNSALPDLSNNITIQGPGASSLTINGGASSSAIFVVDTGETASLSGLTIANGHDGGIANDGGMLTVSSCTLSNNLATNGSGIYNSGTATIQDTTFTNNTATEGGGIYNDVSGTLTVSNSTFGGSSAGNSANDSGGALYNLGTATIEESTLSGNRAHFGGAIFNAQAGNLTIESSSMIVSNSADLNGGGIDNQGATLTVSDSTLANNQAHYGGGIANGASGTVMVSNSTLSGNSVDLNGGAIDNEGGTVTVSTSTLSDNSAHYGGGIYNGSNSTLMVSGSTLSGNSADLNGGGIDNEGGTVTVSTSTLSGNSAHFGGGLYNDMGTLTIQASTLSSNTAANFGGGIYNTQTGTLTIESASMVVGNSPDDLYNLGTADISSDSDVGVIEP